jgi:tyrosyl-tRNA synthetase
VLDGAPLAITAVLKAAKLVTSGAEAVRMIEQHGVRIDGATVSDRQLKLSAGTFVAQVGKRRFARVTLRPAAAEGAAASSAQAAQAAHRDGGR